MGGISSQFFSDFSRGFADSFAAKQERVDRRKREKEREKKQDEQFNRQMALQEARFEEEKGRNVILDRLLMSREEREAAAEGRAAETHEFNFADFRDPAARERMKAARMAQYERPLLELQKAKFEVGTMEEDHARQKASQDLNKQLNEAQLALSEQTIKASKVNNRIIEETAPFKIAAEKLQAEKAARENSAAYLSREDAIKDMQLHAHKVTTIQAMQAIALANAQERRAWVQLNERQAGEIAEKIAVIAPNFPGTEGKSMSEKLTAASKYLTEAYSTANDVLDARTIRNLGGSEQVAPEYEQWKKDVVTVYEGTVDGRPATDKEMAEAKGRSESFMVKVALADPTPKAKPKGQPAKPLSGSSFLPRNVRNLTPEDFDAQIKEQQSTPPPKDPFRDRPKITQEKGSQILGLPPQGGPREGEIRRVGR